MSEKDALPTASEEKIDEILSEILGTNGSYGEGYYDLFRRYATAAEGDTATEQAPQEAAPAQPKKTPDPPAAPRNTAQAVPTETPSPEQLAEEYRVAAAKYEVNGYRFSVPVQPAYPPYAPYGQPMMYPYPYAPPAYPYPPYGLPLAPYGQAPYYDPNYAQPAESPEPAAAPNPYAESAGERVVYDADWENGAPRTQVPARSYTNYPPQQPATPAPAQQPVAVPKPVIPVPGAPGVGHRRPTVNPAFIDPVSDDDESDEGAVSFNRRKAKNAEDGDASDFFQEGFSAARISNGAAAGGKTGAMAAAGAEEEVFDSFSSDYEREQERKTRWMRTDEEVREEKEKRLAEAARREESKSASPVYNDTPPAYDDTPSAHDEPPVYDDTPSAHDEPPVYDDTPPQIYEPEGYAHKDYNGGETAMENSLSDIDEDTANKKSRKKRGKFASFLYRNTPHRGQSKKDFISSLVMDIALVVLVGGLIFCVIYFNNFRNTKLSDEGLEELFKQGQTISLDGGNVTLEEQWANLKAQYPDVVFPDGINIRLAKLYAINSDVVGWLTIDNISVSVPILQADDNDFYLYRDTYKEQTKYGTPFVDADNDMSAAGLSRNTIVYGHNTHDGLKFYNLTRYLELSGYKSAPVVTMESLFQGTTYWKIFAVCLADANNESEFAFLYTDFNNESDFLQLVSNIKGRSLFDTSVDVEPGDKMLTLYTCYQNYFSGGRLVVFAREVRDGEDTTVDVTQARVNADCIYPAAYYGNSGSNSDTDDGGDVVIQQPPAVTPTQGTSPTGDTTPEPPTEPPATPAPDEPDDGGAGDGDEPDDEPPADEPTADTPREEDPDDGDDVVG